MRAIDDGDDEDDEGEAHERGHEQGSHRQSGTTGQTWMRPNCVPSLACQSGTAVLTQPAEASVRTVPACPEVMPLMWTRRSPSGRAPGPPAPAATRSVREPATTVSVVRSTRAAPLAAPEALGMASKSRARLTSAVRTAASRRTGPASLVESIRWRERSLPQRVSRTTAPGGAARAIAVTAAEAQAPDPASEALTLAGVPSAGAGPRERHAGRVGDSRDAGTPDERLVADAQRRQRPGRDLALLGTVHAIGQLRELGVGRDPEDAGLEFTDAGHEVGRRRGRLPGTPLGSRAVDLRVAGRW